MLAKIEVEVKKALGLVKAEAAEPPPITPAEKASATAAVSRGPEPPRAPVRR